MLIHTLYLIAIAVGIAFGNWVQCCIRDRHEKKLIEVLRNLWIIRTCEGKSTEFQNGIEDARAIASRHFFIRGPHVFDDELNKIYKDCLGLRAQYLSDEMLIRAKKQENPNPTKE